MIQDEFTGLFYDPTAITNNLKKTLNPIKMIAREHYLEALATVNEYNIQTNKTDTNFVKERILFTEWIYSADISMRLRNALVNVRVRDHKRGFREPKYLDEITKTNFLKARNAGRMSYNEFTEILEKTTKKAFLVK